MVESKLIGLTTQSFREAGGKGVFPDLKMDSPLRVRTNGFNAEDTFNHANFRLREEAEKKGYAYVFGIKYNMKPVERTSHWECEAIGTGYKSKE